MTSSSAARLSLPLKIAYTAFMCVLVPKYWLDYGPTNFLYFCDVALFMTLAAVWWESSLLASAAAVGILMPQSLWMADFLGTLVSLPVTQMTAYMFDPGIPLFTRGLSFFHFWLPIFLVYLIFRLGYDSRSLRVWTGIAWILLPVCYVFLPAPPAPASDPNLPVNVNYVYGLSDAAPQNWVSPLVWLAGLMVVLPLCMYLPTHLLLQRCFRTADQPVLETC